MNVGDTSYRGDTLKCQTKYGKDKKAEAWKQSHVINPINLTLIDLEVKCQRRIRIMNVLDTSSHGDRPMCQILYANVKTNRSFRSDTKTCQKPFTFDLEVNGQHRIGNVNVRVTSSHGAKYSKPMSYQKIVMGRTQKHVKNPSYKFDLEVEVQGRIWIMNIRDPSSYGNTPLFQIYMVSQTKKSYGSDTNQHRQTDGQTDRQSDSYIPRWPSFTWVIIKRHYGFVETKISVTVISSAFDILKFLFVCFGFIVPLEKFSLLWRRHHYRWTAANFDLCLALMAIEHWGSLSVPHLLWHGASVYNGHLRGPVSLTSIAERLAVEISLRVLTT